MRVPDRLGRWVKERGLNMRIGALTALALLLTASTALAATPAAAALSTGADSAGAASCARGFVFSGAEVWIDNCPDNGKPSTGKITGSGEKVHNYNAKYKWSTLYVTLTNGESYAISADAQKTTSQSWEADVRSFYVSNWFWWGLFPPVPGYHNSAEVTL